MLRQISLRNKQFKFINSLKMYTNGINNKENDPIPKAAICIIANEVLTGKTLDTNSNTISKLLFKNGIDLIRIEVIPDDINDISCTINKLSNLVGKNGFVFTSGGIGPTHDDITYEGVAKAFNRKLVLHQPTYDSMIKYFNDKKSKMNEYRKRMAMLPENSTVLLTPSLWVPLAVVENVYILPGVPSLLEKMLVANEKYFIGKPIHRILIRTILLEGDIAERLTYYHKNNPETTIGSYLRSDKKKDIFNNTNQLSKIDYNVQISIEGRDKKQVEDIASKMEKEIQGFRYQ